LPHSAGCSKACVLALVSPCTSGLSEEATVHDLSFPQYAAMPQYREWLPANLRAAYRYLKRG
jgi:hypothetical protein